VSRSVITFVIRRTRCAALSTPRQRYESTALDPLTDIYVDSRRIKARSSVLRFSPRYRHRLGIRLPAMVTPVVNIAGELTGVHATFPDVK
jgi:hypothetical protein